MCAKHKTKALTIKIDMQCRMYEMKCMDEANVHMHLEDLMRMHEQLCGMDATLTDDDLVTIILGSLPKSYHLLINAITMSVAHAKTKLEPDQVIGTLVDEFECLAIEECQLKASENVLAIAKGHTRIDMECWKHRKKGHIKGHCHSKARTGDNDREESGSANTVAEDDGFAFTTTLTETALALGKNPLVRQEINVYDSGTSGHMLPNRYYFITFRDITPYMINAADKIMFQATGIGNAKTSVPNGKTTTHYLKRCAILS